MRYDVVVALHAAFGAAVADTSVSLMIASEWANKDLRMRLRQMFLSCAVQMPVGFVVEPIFFLGAVPPELREEGYEEAKEHQDMLSLGSPDRETEMLSQDRPATLHLYPKASAATLRFLGSLAWLHGHRKESQYIITMQDHSFMDLPRILQELERHQNESLVLGFISADTPLEEVPQEGEIPCETCDQDPEKELLCYKLLKEYPGGLDFRGCLLAASRCNEAPEGLSACVQKANQRGVDAFIYFGSTVAPRWPHGAGWILGRRVREILAVNADDLRKRGAVLDIQIGFWLAAFEDIHFVNLPAEKLALDGHCPDGEVLVASRMTEARWNSWFDETSCSFDCRRPLDIAFR